MTIQQKLSPKSSIFSAENYAIHEAIKLTNSTITDNILILSDSHSALLALQNPSLTNEITQNIQSKLNSSKKKI